MSRRVFWHNVAANLVAAIIIGAAGLLGYRFLYGRWTKAP